MAKKCCKNEPWMVLANNFSAENTDMWIDWNNESGMFGHEALSDNGFQKSWMCLIVVPNDNVTFQKWHHKTPTDLEGKPRADYKVVRNDRE